MDIVAERFNRRFLYRWARVIEFLKLHYILSQRTDSDFWLDNRRPETIPERLSELLELWRHRPPGARDFTDIEEIFPAASYQYILYGMGYGTEFQALNSSANDLQKLNDQLMENKHKLKKLRSGLPTNRVLLNHLAKRGAQ
jgi:tryptophan halogenase